MSLWATSLIASWCLHIYLKRRREDRSLDVLRRYNQNIEWLREHTDEAPGLVQPRRGYVTYQSTTGQVWLHESQLDVKNFTEKDALALAKKLKLELEVV